MGIIVISDVMLVGKHFSGTLLVGKSRIHNSESRAGVGHLEALLQI
jgi:hypothetical protein